jgi:serine/threonine-protein kinase
MVFVPDDVLEHVVAATDAPDLAGTKYRVLRRLGEGGMGEVWAAQDTELGREVALKISAASDHAAELCARLRREAEVIARLEHPGIVPVHDVGVLPDDRVFYAMKLVRGQRLDEWLRKAPDLRAVLRLFVRVCEAVAFAHAHGVIHRDLKPANIMVGEFGEALVMDWGLAKVIGDEPASRLRKAADASPSPTTATQAGTVLGTLAFMPPEQARGEVDTLDGRADVYALGAILYVLLARRPPFDARSPLALQQAVVEGASLPLAKVAPHVPRALVSICEHAMARDRSARYGSARDLAEDVDLWLAGERPRVHRESLIERAGRLAGRHRVLLSLLGAYVLVRLLLAAWAS